MQPCAEASFSRYRATTDGRHLIVGKPCSVNTRHAARSTREGQISRTSWSAGAGSGAGRFLQSGALGIQQQRERPRDVPSVDAVVPGAAGWGGAG